MAKAINAEFSDDDEEEDDNKSNWDEEEKVIHIGIKMAKCTNNCFHINGFFFESLEIRLILNKQYKFNNKVKSTIHQDKKSTLDFLIALCCRSNNLKMYLVSYKHVNCIRNFTARIRLAALTNYSNRSIKM